MTRTPPVMYGYLRQELVGDRIGEVETAMREFASREGLGLATVHREHGASTGALWALFHDVSHAASRHVIVPTPTHMQAGGNADRHALLSQLRRLHQVGIWFLDPDDNAPLVRGYRRRNVPAPQPTMESRPRKPMGHFDLRVSPTSRGLARIRTHELLTRAGLRHLGDPAEQVVLAVLTEAIAAADHSVCERIAAGYPDLAPDAVLTVWFLRCSSALEVQVHEPGARAVSPLSAALTGFEDRGRAESATGGTLTWVRIPCSPSPTVSCASVRSAV